LSGDLLGCRLRVRRRITRSEHMFSASPPTTDMRRLHRDDRFVPVSEMGDTSVIAQARFHGTNFVSGLIELQQVT
jgi:hypothetical protein